MKGGKEMESENMVQGWAVRSVESHSDEPPKYFLDVNNAIAYRQQQRNRDLLLIELQPICVEQAEDLHQSRLRRTERTR